MRYRDLERSRAAYLERHYKYKMVRYDLYDYSILSNVLYKKKTGRGRSGTYNDCIIMADTETSKDHNAQYLDEFGNPDPRPNHVCAWTISIRFFHRNIVTLWGTKPSQFTEALQKIRDILQGDDIYIYWHHLAYDWIFIRQYMFMRFGFPKKQLNTKSLYPICIKFDNGIIFKDSLILAGCKLEKWAEDLNVAHQKAVGKWDYNLIRDQKNYTFSKDELTYIENDTRAGVECIDALLGELNKTIYSIPYTATGIPREEVRNRAKQNRGHEKFLSQALTYDQFIKAVEIYHGGYTHANRYFIDIFIEGEIRCFDEQSAYPFALCAFRYPAGKFKPYKNCKVKDILKYAEDYAFMFKVSFINIKLKDMLEPMPALQTSKCKESINLQTDNGRVISAGYCTLYICEVDLQIIADIYTWEDDQCTEVEVTTKDYLPRWFTDYVYEMFAKKCEIKPRKDEDPVAYSLAKSRVNSLYGLCCQKSIREEAIEVVEAGYYKINREGDEEYFESGEYRIDFDKDMKKEYEKYLKRQTSVLNYQTGIWCTSYAMAQIFRMGQCIKRYYKKNPDGSDSEKLAMPVHWYYTDTDSCYSDDWDYNKLYLFNERCKDLLKANNYGAVIVDGVEYWLGVAESHPKKDAYSEYKVLGSKRYAGRSLHDNELHITVAGVPKRGAASLEDDLNNFTKDHIFKGELTGKLSHFYIFHEPYIDEYGNEIADSIDLQPCDYHLDAVNKWDFIEEEEIIMECYTEGEDPFTW